MRKIFGFFVICLFCVNYAYGYVTENVPSGCRTGMSINAVFEANTYTCQSGYYLPANAISCQACPAGYTCPGGNFTFDENTTQGITYGDLISQNVTNGCDSLTLPQVNGSAKLNAKWRPNEIPVTWYSDGVQITNDANAATVCTYGEDFSLPTPPTKTGYVFDGWTIRPQ